MTDVDGESPQEEQGIRLEQIVPRNSTTIMDYV